MKKFVPHWFVRVLSLMLIGLAVDYFFLHLLFEKKEARLREQTAQELTTSEKEILAQGTPLHSANNLQLQEAETNSELNTRVDGFSAQIKLCLGEDSPFASAQNSDELIQKLTLNDMVTSEIVDIENYNFLLKDGSERRLHIIPKDESNSTAREIRYYKLDDEGYPERLTLPFGMDDSFSAEKITKLLEGVDLKLHQLKKSYSLEDGSSLQVDIRNKAIYELLLQTPDKNFSCRQDQCQCD
ncbi:MAG: hypothetical protein ACLGGX_02395 [Bdellovibrionia bacterium]